MYTGTITGGLEPAAPLYLKNALDKLLETFGPEELASAGPGRHEVDGEAVYVNIACYETGPRQEKTPEAHDRYADVHIMLRGIEAIGISARAGQKVEKDLRETEDAVLYSTGMEDERQVVLREGELLVCLPGDIHRPGCRVDGAQTIKKAILKVLIA